MLTPDNLNAAILEAERFLKVARKVQFTRHQFPSHGPTNAATRRASMDLTRALANLRGPRS